MTTILTEIGWEDENGNPLGTWTNQADLVDEGDEITVAEGVTANSLAGNDIIIGTGKTPLPGFYAIGTRGISNTGTIDTSAGRDIITTTGDYGIYNESNGTIDTGDGSDIITSTGRYSIYNDGSINTGVGNDVIIVGITTTPDIGGVGIRTNGIIDTGAGNDIITSTSNITDSSSIVNAGTIDMGDGRDIITGIGNTTNSSGIDNAGTIDMGDGRDIITGIGALVVESAGGGVVISYGITNINTINTGAGNDIITGNAASSIGIYNSGEGTINTGAGNDIITGNGNPAGSYGYVDYGTGIYNDNTIDTGAGNDTVDALTGGFGGSGLLDLGSGRDLIRGFGEQIVDGGRGFDTAELGIDFDENLITFGSTGSTSIDITFDSATMSFTDVELFNFNGQEFALEQLQDIV